MTRAVVFLLALALIGFVAGGTMERHLLYPFDATRKAPPPGLSESTLATPDGETLVVWTAAPAPGEPTLLYFHGNGGNLALRNARFAALTERGFGLVAAGYRGSSGSTGRPLEAQLIDDAELVHAKAQEIANGAAVVVYGESLGASVSLGLAERQPLDALVLEAPFLSIAAMADVLYGIPALARLSRSQWDNLARVPQVTAPLYIVHGALDGLVPPDHSRALYEAAGSTDKTYDLVPDAGHTNIWATDARERLFAFIDRF